MNNILQSLENKEPHQALAALFQEVVDEMTTLQEPRIEKVIQKVLIDTQGAWLRPKLIFAIGQENNLPFEQTLTVAAVAEMVHCASLLHDDVVDEGFTRRGQPTANAQYGNAAAVLCGDVLMSSALELLAQKHPIAISAAARTIKELSHSALLEQDLRYRFHAQPQDWVGIAEKKTGSLLGFCLAGLHETKQTSTCFELGYTLGQFFQLCDDLKDFQTSGTGKPALQDLKNGNLNWVLLQAAERNPLFRKGLQQLWREPRTTHDYVSFFESWDLKPAINEGYLLAKKLKKQFAIQSQDLLSTPAHHSLQQWLDTVIHKAQQPAETKDSKVSLQSA
jgi:geranylgeranyl pyrophosphate synthase